MNRDDNCRARTGAKRAYRKWLSMTETRLIHPSGFGHSERKLDDNVGKCNARNTADCDVSTVAVDIELTGDEAVSGRAKL